MLFFRWALVTALVLSQLNYGAIASDWVEEAPRPAPDFRRAANGTAPDSDESIRQHPVVTVNPEKVSGALVPGKPLEANVSKWGSLNQRRLLDGSIDRSAAAAAAGMTDTGPQLLPGRAVSVPPETFRLWMQKTHPEFALNVTKSLPQSILEVKGEWDDAGRALKSFGLPYTRIGKGKLAEVPLDSTRVIVVNCAGDLPRHTHQRIRDFVARGGFLITTDWALDNLIERCFPGYIEWDGNETSSCVVDAQVVDFDPMIFRGTVTNATWLIDDKSKTIKILKPQSVRTLVTSRQLQGRIGNGILAVTFQFGRGQVLHLLGHFDNNSGMRFRNTLPDAAPVMGISLRQAMSANFIYSGMCGKPAQTAAQ